MAVESVVQRILLVEESATLRYIMEKALLKQGYELAPLETFDGAINTLNNPEDKFHAVIIGWPNYEQHRE